MSEKNNDADLPEQVEAIYEYKIVEGESTALSAVFNKLFEMVEKELRS